MSAQACRKLSLPITEVAKRILDKHAMLDLKKRFIFDLNFMADSFSRKYKNFKTLKMASLTYPKIVDNTNLDSLNKFLQSCTKTQYCHVQWV